MKKFFKDLLLFTPLILLLLPIITYISIMLFNNGIAYNTLKELKSIELPPNTKIECSESKAGKLVGSGNGMQYFGSILVDSDLTENELKEYYKTIMNISRLKICTIITTKLLCKETEILIASL